MKKQDGYTPIPEDTKCSGDCFECPYFFKIGYLRIRSLIDLKQRGVCLT